jgi:hypothetical protein
MPSDIGEFIVCNECEQWRDVSDNHCPECDACWSVRDDPEQNLELPVGICNDCKNSITGDGK